MSGNNLVKTAGVFLLALSLSCTLKAQSGPSALPPIPSLSNLLLSTWSFDDTNWISDFGDAPISFTNLLNPASWDGNALQVDSTNAAWLSYPVVGDWGDTNITFDTGSIEFWFIPDWNSASVDGGSGIGNWGNLITVGNFTTNATSSWWSLYFTPDGNNIRFSSETNGAETNYLSYPISWDSSTWHLVTLTYTPTRSDLYIDGEWVTNGAGVLYVPDAEATSNSFFIGSSANGQEQMRGQMDNLAIYNFPLFGWSISNEFANENQQANGSSISDRGGFHADDAPSLPGFEDGSTNDYSPGIEGLAPDYGTNLFIAQMSQSSGNYLGIMSNTLADVQYEIQYMYDLQSTNGWQSASPYWVFPGSEVTNWTVFNISMTSPSNMFFRVRSWASDDGSGLPLWWEKEYFSTNVVDPNAQDSAEDGWTIYQKYTMGLNPNVFYTPPTPAGITVAFKPSTDLATITWVPSPGAVTNYVIDREVGPFSGGGTEYFNVPPGTDNFTDNVSSVEPDLQNGGSLDVSYQMEAQYAGGNSAWSITAPL